MVVIVGIAGSAWWIFHGQAKTQAPLNADRANGPSPTGDIKIPSTLASAATPAIAAKPTALPTSNPDQPAIQADVLLQAWPENASTLASRPDAKSLTLEGKVREVRTEKLANGSSETLVVIVGTTQTDDAPAHFTCHVASGSQANAGRLKNDQVVRITGAIGPVTTAANRVDMLECTDIKVVATPNADPFIGHWRSLMTQMDGWRQRMAAHTAGLGVEDIPNGIYSTAALTIEAEFKADGTLTAVLLQQRSVQKTVTGKWQIVKAGTKPRIRIEVVGEPALESPLPAASSSIALDLPGFSDQYVMPTIELLRVQGNFAKVDWQSMRDEATKWITANNALANPQRALSGASSFLDGLGDGDGYAIVLGSEIPKSGKTTALVGAGGKFFVLEYSAAQTALNAQTSKGIYTSRMSAFMGPLFVPEVFVDALVIDNQTAIDPTKPLTGKVTMHSVGRVYAGPYELVLACEGAKFFCNLKEGPGADTRTIDFQFPVMRAPSNVISLNPRIAVITVVRNTDMEPKVISDPQVMLLDLVPAK
jgi:hypothetical protein